MERSPINGVKSMTNQHPIIDLRHQIDWRRRVLSEACTLGLWTGAAFLFNHLWRSTAHGRPSAAMTHRAVTHIGMSVSQKLAIQLSEAGVAARHSHAIAVPVFNNPWIVLRAAHHASAHTLPFAASGIDRGVLGFAASLLAAAAFLLLWKLGSAVGIRPLPSNREHEARTFKLCATSLQVARNSQICTVHHDDDGQILAISRHPPSTTASLKTLPRLAPESGDANSRTASIAA